MAGKIEPPALEIVADARGGEPAEFQLFGLGKIAAEAGIVRCQLRADGIQERHQSALELTEQFADRRRRHALVGVVDMRIGDMRVRSEKLRILAAQVERLFQIRHHALEVVRRPRRRPGLVGRRTVCAHTRNVVRRYFDGFLIVALRGADDPGGVAVMRQAVAVRDQCLDQPANGGRHQPLVRKLREQRHLAAARVGAAGRHIGGLIPLQHRARRIKIANLTKTHFQLRQHGVRRTARARRFFFCCGGVFGFFAAFGAGALLAGHYSSPTAAA
jgi:hypothetical protein